MPRFVGHEEDSDAAFPDGGDRLHSTLDRDLSPPDDAIEIDDEPVEVERTIIER